MSRRPPDWLQVKRSDAPLILAFPHTGQWIPQSLEGDFASRWTALRDTDWHVERLYEGLVDATIVRTAVSRSVIDCNRDPSGASLYPGQASTELCPTTTFDGAPLYRPGCAPAIPDIAARRTRWFEPYHAAITAEIERLRVRHTHIAVYDCHSIRSRIPRLFEGDLPVFNIGTNRGTTCDPALAQAVLAKCEATGRGAVLDGRFRGGWTTRHHARPEHGVHAVQMELAIRAYAEEPGEAAHESNWPPPWDAARAATTRRELSTILTAITEHLKDIP